MEAFGIKSTMAMKMTSISTRESTRGNNSFVRCSERNGSPMAVCKIVGVYCPSSLFIACLVPIPRHISPLSHIPQFRERKNRIVNRPDQADEEPVDEELAAPEPGYANVNHCGCARGQCPQNIGK